MSQRPYARNCSYSKCKAKATHFVIAHALGEQGELLLVAKSPDRVCAVHCRETRLMRARCTAAIQKVLTENVGKELDMKRVTLEFHFYPLASVSVSAENN